VARLTEIALEMKHLLEDISVANGYEIDMGSVNENDQALIKYPSAEITYMEESPDTSTLNALYGHAVAKFAIKVKAELLSVEQQPVWAIDEEYDKIIAAIKKKFGADAGSLALTYNPLISYDGFSKEVAPSGDVFVPGAVITRWNVCYQYTE